jgi:hypothetical protein
MEERTGCLATGAAAGLLKETVSTSIYPLNEATKRNEYQMSCELQKLHDHEEYRHSGE